MDTVTQIALGAAVGEATLGRKVGWRAPLWGGLCGLLPDLDVLWPFADPVSAFTWHRGYTHALAVLVLAAPVVAWAAVRLPSRDPSVPAGLAAPRIPRARHPPAPRLLHGLRNADLPALLGSSGGLVDDLHHRPGVQCARHPRCARRAGPLARARARAPAQSRGPRARRRLARPHAGHQGARRPRGRRFPAGRGDPLPHHAVAVQRGALASGRDDRRWAVSRGLLLAAGLGATGVVREPGGRPRAARTASQRSGGGARHLVFPGILQRPGARERRDRDLRPSDGIRRAARVLVRGGPPRGGCDRTRAASSRTR